MKTMVRIFVAIVLLATGTGLEAQQQKKVWRLGVFHVGLDHVPGSLQRLKEGLAARVRRGEKYNTRLAKPAV